MMANIRLLHPEYEYLFFDDRAVVHFIDQEYPEYRTVFDSFPFNIQRYDFFRYLAVHRYGGFYLDQDVMLAESVSDLREAGCVFPFEGLTYSLLLRRKYQMDWQLGNFAFGAAAGHPFLEAVIENCVRAQKDSAWAGQMMRGIPMLSKKAFQVLYTTGPGLVSRTLAEHPELEKTVLVLFPDDVCAENDWNQFGEYGVHLMDNTWLKRPGRIRNRIVLELEAFKMRMRLRESRALGKTRYYPNMAKPSPSSKDARGCLGELVSNRTGFGE
jgi:hypothetical protein